MNMLPEQQDTQSQEPQIHIDEAWIVSRLLSIIYFIEFQYGEEATAAMEQVANNLENSLRNSEGNVQ